MQRYHCLTLELAGKIAVVTGGGDGIGRAISLALANEGATLVIVDIDKTAGDKVALEIKKTGQTAVAVKTDVSSKPSVEAMASQITEVYGGIDILVNNAGVQYVSPTVDIPEHQWQRVIDVMLSGTFFCTQVALKSMIPRETGRIVNISSVLGKVGAKFKAPYTAAKHGILGLTKATALEVAELGITVNAICPGVTATKIVENQLQDLSEVHGITRDQVLEEVFFPHVPQKRLMDPDEIAAFAVYLVSDKAQAITGQAINVSAGWVM